ncbi:MAG: VWA domain-containing protein [Pelagimonas sp.]
MFGPMRQLAYGICLMGLSCFGWVGAAVAERTVFILDASSSMETELNGETRLVVAKAAVRSAIGTIHRGSPEHEVGLVSFYDGCWVHPMAPVAPLASNRGALLQHVAGLATRKYGHTPIARALEIAAEQLEGKGGSIILVSDGEETCDKTRDMCEIAQDLRRQNVELKVHFIALTLNQAQREAMLCIPKTTGGTFVAVETSADLKDAMQIAAEMAAQSSWDRCYDNRGGFLHLWCGE